MKNPLPQADMELIEKIVAEQDRYIELPYRAKVKAPHNSTSTNGLVWRYFLQFEEAARCPGRIGIPEYAPGQAKGVRPQWLIEAQIEQLVKNALAS